MLLLAMSGYVFLKSPGKSTIIVKYPMYAKVNDNVVMFKIRNVMRLLQYEVLPLKTWVYN